jgi:low affinity Fe/Cu permease
MNWFRILSQQVAHALGSAWGFGLACICVLVWIATGPYFHYSDTWQLVINTGTTIVTFLAVFLIQHTQARDSRAIHLKLDEVIRAINEARNSVIDLEHCTDAELERLEKEFGRLRDRAEFRDKSPRPSKQAAAQS